MDACGIINLRGIMQMKILMGRYEYVLDEKGRTRIPQAYKDILGDNLFIAEGMGKFLTVCNEETIQQQSEEANKYKSLHTISKEEMALVKYYRDLFSCVSPFVPDGQKRYRIPKSMIKYAELDGDIVIAGNNQVLEIWSAKNYEIKDEQEIAFFKLIKQGSIPKEA